jgi:hypothetical protein
MERRILIASWLFLIGSGLFMVDAIAEIAERFSLASLRHLSEGIVFFVGSLLLMPEPTTASSKGLELDNEAENPSADWETDR